jgi:hypothetical protein
MAPRRSSPLVLLLAALLGACSTPYRPPVVVQDSANFPGVATVAKAAGAQPVDVLVVHGMCTHDRTWATRAIDRLAGDIGAHAPATAGAPPAGAIEVVDSTRRVAGGTVRFHALVWSPLTADLKHQLDDDRTAAPVRARFNGLVKDKLLDDCLADPLIYEGTHHAAMRDAMVETIARIIAANPDENSGMLVVVAESLGSKMLFDALSAMLESRQPRLRTLGQQASRRLGLLFMAANQLPMLALAGQPAAPGLAVEQDALQRFLALRRSQAAPRIDGVARLAVVAFTDPNDLLSYRLLPARYAAPDVAVADVLVSNARTWLGLIENPVAAHRDYLLNPNVARMIVCGHPRVAGCR